MSLPTIDEIRRWHASRAGTAEASFFSDHRMWAHARDVGVLLEALDMATGQIGAATTAPMPVIRRAHLRRDEHLAYVMGWNARGDRDAIAASSALLRAHLSDSDRLEMRAMVLQAIADLRRSAF